MSTGSSKGSSSHSTPIWGSSANIGGIRFINDIGNYDSRIDDFKPELTCALQDFSDHLHLINSDDERGHYHGLADFLNDCLTAFRTALDDKANDAYNHVEFWENVINVQDLDSILRKSVAERPSIQLLWSPPGDQAEMTAPAGVEGSWRELLLQTGTYSCCLYRISPFRPFRNVVLGYHRNQGHFRSLAYHRGASSRDLDPFAPEGRKDILRLFLSLLTLKSRSDVGFPAWNIGASVSLPGRKREMVADVDSVPHSSLVLNMFRAKVRNAKSPFSSGELGSLTPVTRITLRHFVQVRQISGNCTSDLRIDSLPCKSLRLTFRVKDWLVSAEHLVEWSEDSNALIQNMGPVIKCSWALDSSSNDTILEQHRLLRECGGVVGIPKHCCSFLAHHQHTYPTTNHLFSIPEDKKEDWNIFRINSSPDPCSLTAYANSSVGKSLVLAPDVPSLVQALFHAHLGKTSILLTMR